MEGSLNNDSSGSVNWRPSTQMDSVCSAMNNRVTEVAPNWRKVDPNWRPSTQMDSVCSAMNNPVMEVAHNSRNVDPNWRNHFPPKSRQMIIEKVFDKRMRDIKGGKEINPEEVDRQREIVKFMEDDIYANAESQYDYMRTIRNKLLQVRSQGQVNSTGCDQRLLASITHFTQHSQVQARPQLLSENIQSSITHSSAGFASALSTMPVLSQAGISTLGGQTNGMSNMSRISQNSLNNSTGQVLSQNTLLKNSPTSQLQARQPQQQQKQIQTQHHLIYQQQSQNLQPQPYHQPLVQQQPQPQQNFLEHNQPLAHVQSPRQPMVHTAQWPIIQSSQQSGHQHTAVLQPANQSVQQSQQYTGQTVPLFSHHQLQQPVHRQQQSVQHSVTEQQPGMCQQAVLHSQHRRMGKKTNVPNKQQKHRQRQIPQHPKSGDIRQTAQVSQALLQSQSQESHHQLQKHQQLHSPLQPESQQFQEQSLLQQPHSNQQEVQHRLQTSDSLLQQQNTPEQYHQPSQQKGLQDVTSTSIDSSGQTGQRTVDVKHKQKVFEKLQSLKVAYSDQMKELESFVDESSQQNKRFKEAHGNKSQQSLQIDQRQAILDQLKGFIRRSAFYFSLSVTQIPDWFTEEKLRPFEKQLNKALDFLQQHVGQQQLKLQTGNKVQQSSQPQISHIQQPDKSVLQQQKLSSQASLVPTQLQHPSVQQQQQQMQHSSFQQQQQQQQIQHPLFQQQQQVQRPSLQQQQQEMQHSSFQQQQEVQHPSLEKQQQQMQHSSFQQQQQMQHSLFQQQQLVRHASFQQQQKQMQHSSFQQQQQVQQPSLQKQQQPVMQQQKKNQDAQQAQINTQKAAQVLLKSDFNSEVQAKLIAAFKPASVQHQQLGQLSVYQQQPQEQQHQQFNRASSLSAASPHLLQASSPQISQHFNPQIEKPSLTASSLQFPKFETPVQLATSPCVASSPSTLPTPSTLLENADTNASSVTTFAQGLQESVPTFANTQSPTIGTPGISASPLLGISSSNLAQNHVNQDGSQNISPGLMMGEEQITEAPVEQTTEAPVEQTTETPVEQTTEAPVEQTTEASVEQTTETPVEHLVKEIRSMSPEIFNSAVSDLCAVVSLSDIMAGSAPARRSKAAVGEDLAVMTRCRLQASNLMSLDSGAAAKKVRRCMSSLPVTIASSDGSLDASHQIQDVESSKMLSTATSTAKRPRLQLDRVLQLEIQNVNEQLIETVVDVSDNDIDAASCGGRDGIVVKCSYNAMAFHRRMNSGYKHAHKSQISPLWLLIPLSYPKCSPVVLNRLPVETNKEHEDLSSKTKAMFDVSVRDLPEPMTLGALAKTWDVCARNVVAEYAYQRGGGNFSSHYGAWEYCASA